MKINQLTILLTSLLIFSGCVYTPVSLPKLPNPPKACPEVKPADPVACPKLDMPDPIPRNMVLERKDGKTVKMDANGEQFIRQYVGAMKAIKSTWPQK